MKRGAAYVWLCLVAACAAQRVVPLRPPPVLEVAPADFGALDLVVEPLVLLGDGVGSWEGYDRLPLLQHQFADYLRSRARFANAYVGVGEGGVNPRLSVNLQVVTQVDTSRTWLLDILAVATLGLWPVSPQWGHAAVTATAIVTDVRNQQLFHHATTARVPYSLLFFTLYRTNAIEQALREAYERVFLDIAEALAEERALVLARLARRSSKTARRVVVLPVQRTDAAAVALPQLLDDYVLAAVQEEARRRALSVADLDAVLTLERQKDLAGCAEAACFAELTGALDVDLVLVVGVANVEGTWMATSKLIDVRVPRVEARARHALQGGADLMTELPDVVRQVLAAGVR